MKYMHQAIWQSDCNVVMRGNSRALLFRALEDVRGAAAADPQVARTLKALQDALGNFDGTLPSANELLGDPVKQQVSRNLLKFTDC
jgi:hypothetical protein